MQKSPYIVKTHALVFPREERKSFSLYLVLLLGTLFVSQEEGLIFEVDHKTQML